MTNRNEQEGDEPTGLSFEQTIGQLDETVKALEAGGLPLAEATRLFEEGMKLARLCSEMLASAEISITRIQTAYGEQMRMLEQEEAAGHKDRSC